MVGRTPFDPRKCCPFPHMTQPVLPGEEFEALEYVSRNDFKWVLSRFERPIFTRFPRMDSSKWILARKKGTREGDDKYMFRLPLRALAPKGDIESYYWYFGELDRQATNDLLRSRDYPRGTFAVRINQKDSRYYSLSIINRVRTGM